MTLYFFRGVFTPKNYDLEDEIAGTEGLCSHVHILDVYAWILGLCVLYISCLSLGLFILHVYTFDVFGFL